MRGVDPLLRAGSSLIPTRFKERVAGSPLLTRLARGFFWSVVGGAASRVFAMAAAVVAARLVGREGYGEIGMVQSTLGLFGVFAGFGLGTTATKYVSEFRGSDTRRTGRILQLACVLAIGLSVAVALTSAGLAPWLSRRVLGRADLASLVVAGSVLMLVSSLSSLTTGVLAGFESFRQIATIGLWQGILLLVVTIPFTWHFGTQGAIAALSVSAAIATILTARAIQAQCRLHGVPIAAWDSAQREARTIAKFAVPSTLSALMVAPVGWATSVLLAHQVDGYAQLGLFNAANQMRSILIFLPMALTTALLPVLSETFGRGDRDGFGHTLTINLRVVWAVALPVTAALLAMRGPISALFGPSFRDLAGVLALSLVAVFFTVLGGQVGTALAGAGRMWAATAMNLGWGVLTVGLSLILVPRFGARGLAAAYALAYIAHACWSFVYGRAMLGLEFGREEAILLGFTIAILGFQVLDPLSPVRRLLLETFLVGLSLVPLCGQLVTFSRAARPGGAGERQTRVP